MRAWLRDHPTAALLGALGLLTPFLVPLLAMLQDEGEWEYVGDDDEDED